MYYNQAMEVGEVRIAMLIGISLVFVPTLAFAAPLDFMKLSWSMSPGEMQQSLEKRGFKCTDEELFSSKWVDCKKADGNIAINAGKGEVTFNCAAFNGCKKTYKEMLKSLKKKYGGSFDYSQTKTGDLPTLSRHCRSGEDGDRVFIQEAMGYDLNYNPKAEGFEIFLLKGSLGEEMDF